MLAGHHLEELYKDDYEAVMLNTDANPSAVRSANYTTFTALGMRVVNVCKRKNYRTNIIFDSCLLCNEAFKKLYERFNVMENNEILELWTGKYHGKVGSNRSLLLTQNLHSYYRQQMYLQLL